MSSTQPTTQYENEVEVDDLSSTYLSELLERNPDAFLELVSRNSSTIKTAVINWLNDTSIYNTWYSYGWAQLIYLVGDLVSQEEEGEEEEGEEGEEEESIDYRDYFYGGNSAISDEQGCEIFNLLIEINGSSPNVNVTNIYKENINDIILREGTLHDRTNNEQFNALVLRTTGYQVDEQ